MINTLQSYYGLAIRQNKGNFYGMKKAIAAIPHHCYEIEDKELQHLYCERGPNSWCKYQRGNKEYKSSIKLDKEIFELIKKIFSASDLGANDLLEKCLHGETQNINEAFNGIIWSKCPPNIFVGRKTLEMGVFSAVINFNDGESGLVRLLDLLRLPVGYFTIAGLAKEDDKRVKVMDYKSLEVIKNRRKKLRAIGGMYVCMYAVLRRSLPQ